MEIIIHKNEQPSSHSILIPKGTSFTGANTSNDQRVFYTIDDVFIKTIIDVDTDNVKYQSELFTIYEGQYQKYKFLADTTIVNQRYIIRDKNIDIDTIKIIVCSNGDNICEEYFFSDNVLDNIDENSPLYYLSTNIDGYYEIVFGNNIYGKTPSNESIINVYYMSTNGESGNGCKRMIFNAPTQTVTTEHSVGNWDDFVVIIEGNQVSSGGTDVENIESMRHNIPHHYKSQKRIVTAMDYRSKLINEFRNIDSVNVWGGEENYHKNYGKVYICIKPKYADKLTLSAKNEITNKLFKKYSVVGTEPIFIDPEFLNLEIDLYAKIDTKKTNKTFGEFEKEINDLIFKYNSDYLNVFDNFFSDVSMLEMIKKDTAIKSCYTKKKINKDQNVIYNSGVKNILFFGNTINTGIKSSYFNYGNTECYFMDDISTGYIYIYKKIDGKKYVEKNYGNVNYKDGIIEYYFPQYANTTENNFITNGIINFTVVPYNTDVDTYLQNIIRITKTRIYLQNI